MANFRVKCPACTSELELDEAFEGQEAECGSCGHVFVARKPAPVAPPAPRERPPPRPDRPERSDRPGGAGVPGPPPPRARRREPEEREPEDAAERADRDATKDEDRDAYDREPGRDRPRPRRPPPRPSRIRRRALGRPDGEDAPPDESEYAYEDTEYGPPPERETSLGDSLAVAALVLGLASFAMVVVALPFSCCCAFLPLPFTIPLSLLATVIGVAGLRGDSDRKPLAVVGLILGVLCAAFVVAEMSFRFLPQLK